MVYQQGDVILEKVEEIPANGKKILPSPKGYVLAEGETTGHAHVLTDVQNVEVIENDGMFFVKIKQPTELAHEEHKNITISPGIYRVRKVREYDHFAEEARNVTD